MKKYKLETRELQKGNAEGQGWVKMRRKLVELSIAAEDRITKQSLHREKCVLVEMQ